MRNRRVRSGIQMGLFHPRVAIPRWEEMPAEVRQEALVLLARLLWHQQRGQLAERVDRQARDE